MQITSRFTIAVHIITCIHCFQDDYKVTSNFIQGDEQFYCRQHGR